MKAIIRSLLAFAALAFSALSCMAAPLSILAAENFYGDIASQIAGAGARVSSVLANPDQDPHLFEANASTIRKAIAAKIVIANGAGYDSWMGKLLSANPSPGRITIVAADLVHKSAGDNPHIWYDPATMKALASRLAQALERADPANGAGYAAREAAFLASLKPLDKKISVMRTKYSGTAVTASEPVFAYMAAALGLRMRNQGFQLAIQNGAEPSPSQVAAFETDLRTRAVKAMIYNRQASAPAAQRLVAIAKAQDIPVVGVTETEPAGMTYQHWMTSELQALDRALAGPRSAK